MKGKKLENNLEAMKVHPNQTTLWPCCAFYKYIIRYSCGIVFTDILVKKNEARSEEDN